MEKPERFYGEFLRRIKTQGTLPNEDAALVVLFGLFASGQIRMNRISGWREMIKVIKTIDKAA